MNAKTKPETLSQAQTWQRVCRLAEGAGLCTRCASQVAWGSQGGFSSVREPCAACTVVMLEWPVAKPNGWRVPGGTLSSPQTWAPFTSTGRTALGTTPGEV
jgi:hypothetical protein